MPSKYLVVDENDDSRTAKVFSNRAVKVVPAYSYFFIPNSAAATGVILAAAGVLHSVVFQDSATATTYLVLSDNATTVGEVGNSASAVAQFGTITKNTFILDALLNSGLTYRVTGSAIGPTVITYAAAS